MNYSFGKYIESNQKIIGLHHFKQRDDAMDLDFFDKQIIDCKFINGDFCSGIFKNCTLENVEFKNCALIGVGFHNCIFKNCKFSKTQYSFGFKNCTIESLSIEN